MKKRDAPKKRPKKANGNDYVEKVVKAFKKLSKLEKTQFVMEQLVKFPVNNVVTGSYQVTLEDVKHVNAVNINDALADEAIIIDDYNSCFEQAALDYLKKVITTKISRGEEGFTCGYCKKKLSQDAVACEGCLQWFDAKCHKKSNQADRMNLS